MNDSRVCRGEQVAGIEGASAAHDWTAANVRELLEFVASQKGVAEDADIYLLREARQKFKAAGISKLAAREAVIAMMQQFLTPKPKSKSEDLLHLAKEFLKAAQSGVQVELAHLLKAHPSLLTARSSSKGYTAMHYAAMAGAIPTLEWLTSHGLNPDVASTPSDGTQSVSPAEVAEAYKRDEAVRVLRALAEGFKFLKATPAPDDDTRLCLAARAGNANAVAMILWRDPSVARRAQPNPASPVLKTSARPFLAGTCCAAHMVCCAS